VRQVEVEFAISKEIHMSKSHFGVTIVSAKVSTKRVEFNRQSDGCQVGQKSKDTVLYIKVQ
jgi:hypothetical protein